MFKESELKFAPIAIWSMNTLVRLLGLYAVIQGLNIILTSPRGWGSPALDVALDVPGAPPIWGWVILIAGVLILIGDTFNKNILTIIGGWVASVWCSSFLITLGASAMQNNDSSTLGLPSYGFFLVLYAGVAVTHQQVRRANRDAASSGA